MVAINAAWETIGDPKRGPATTSRRRAARPRRPGRRSAARRRRGPASAGPRHRGAWTGAGRPPVRGPGPEPVDRPSRGRPRPCLGTGRRGRSTTGSGYDAKTMRAPEGYGAAGPPPGNPSGSVLNFGRYAGWSLGEIGADRPRIHRVARPDADRAAVSRRDRRDPAAGRPARERAADATQRRGLFRRR